MTAELGIPVAALHAELHALVRRGHVDPGDLLNQGALVLEPEPEGQIHLPGLHVPVVVLRPVHPIGLTVKAPPGGDLLIHIYEQPRRDHVGTRVDAGLLDSRSRRSTSCPACLV